MTDFNEGSATAESGIAEVLGFTESQNGENISVHELEDGTIQVEIRDSTDIRDGWYLSLTTDEASYLAGILHGTALKIVGQKEKTE